MSTLNSGQYRAPMARTYRASARDVESAPSSENTSKRLFSTVPLPLVSLPMISLFNTASISCPRSFSRLAIALAPTNPCSSPANATNTSVASNSY